MLMRVLLIGAIATAVACASAPTRRTGCDPVPAALASADVYSACDVDREAKLSQALGQRHPRESRSIIGCFVAVVNAVVDTSGRPAPASVSLARTNDREYGDAVAAEVGRARYRPAMRNGVAVKQFVQETAKVQYGTTDVFVPRGTPPPPVPTC